MQDSVTAAAEATGVTASEPRTIARRGSEWKSGSLEGTRKQTRGAWERKESSRSVVAIEGEKARGGPTRRVSALCRGRKRFSRPGLVSRLQARGPVPTRVLVCAHVKPPSPLVLRGLLCSSQPQTVALGAHSVQTPLATTRALTTPSHPLPVGAGIAFTQIC